MNVLINSGRTSAYLTVRRKLITSIIEKGHRVVLTGYQEGYEEELEAMGASFIKVPFNRAGFKNQAIFAPAPGPGETPYISVILNITAPLDCTDRFISFPISSIH